MTTTLQLVPLAAALGGAASGGAGATFAAAQFIIASVSTDRSQKLILPKIEPAVGEGAASRGCGWAGGAAAAASKLADVRATHRKRKSPAGSSERDGVHAIKPASVSRRNARERNRVKQVNQGFVTLASHVPPSMRSKKMSKVETLRAAIRYIGYLYDAVEQKPRLATESQLDDTYGGDAIGDSHAGGGHSASSATSAPSATARTIDSTLATREATPEAPSDGGRGDEQLPSRLQLLPPPTPLPHSHCGAVAASMAADRLASALEAAAVAAARRYDVPTCMMSPAPSSAYDAPSPSGSVASSSGSWGAGSSLSPASATSSSSGDVCCSYESCLSPSSEELLDFANWFCTNS